MLPVNSSSNLKAKGFIDKINETSCIPSWMKNLFSAEGTDLRIVKNYKFPKGSKPGWFDTWHTAAFTAWHQDEWELTTGAVRHLGNDKYLLQADGVSIGRKDDDGHWLNTPLGSVDAGGQTVPTEAMTRDLNALRDKKLHYTASIVKAKVDGRTRGVIVVGDRQSGKSGGAYHLNADQFTLTLFHELFHAGQISAGKPNADADPRFSRVADFIDHQFSHCAP